MSGPGTELKSILLRFGIAPGNCQCRDMAARMDENGWEWSLDHMEEIVNVMKASAISRKMPGAKTPIAKVVARRLVRMAVKRASRIDREMLKKNEKNGAE